jgi:hypothetical protein
MLVFTNLKQIKNRNYPFNKEKPIMFYVLNWFIVVSLLALWSFAAWGFHSIAAWMVSNAGTLKANSGEIFSLAVPDWLAPWMPPELISALPAMVSALTPVVDSLLSFAPAMGGVLSVAVWVVWGIGSILLVLMGIVLSAVIALMLRRRSARSGRAMATRSYG